MPIYLHNVQHGHRISNLLIFQRDGLYIFAPPEGQMSLVSLFTSGLFDAFPKLQFIFTEAGTAFIKPLVQWLDTVLESRRWIMMTKNDAAFQPPRVTKIRRAAAARAGTLPGAGVSRKKQAARELLLQE